MLHFAVVSSQGNVTRCTRTASGVAEPRFTARFAELMLASEGMDERSNAISPSIRVGVVAEVMPTFMLGPLSE
ncbi:hypothetical protein SCE1572_12155 [Sorangium cellulosum So0157-2]|uniref:Uncharacterized protein n=1 Tax=Sorangium cellulosum So0157-2 TaxID=1254432 RepID=S4XX59_SORCE|nr:hypothetical protein SCE1572_12155 [Sorangium cellulosum So0157-2]